MLPKILCVSQQECYNSNLPFNGHRDRERTKTLVAKLNMLMLVLSVIYSMEYFLDSGFISVFGAE